MIEMKSRGKEKIVILSFDAENEKTNILTTRTNLMMFVYETLNTN